MEDEEEKDVCPECGGEVRLVFVGKDGRGLLSEKEIERLRVKAVVVSLESDQAERYLSGDPELRYDIRERILKYTAILPESEGGCWVWQATLTTSEIPIMRIGRAGRDIRRWLWLDAGGRICDPWTMLRPVTPDPALPRSFKGTVPASCGKGGGRRCIRPRHWKAEPRHPLPSGADHKPGRPGAGLRDPDGSPADIIAVIEIRNDRSSHLVTYDRWIRGAIHKLNSGVTECGEDEYGNHVFELERGMVVFRNSEWIRRTGEASRKIHDEKMREWKKIFPGDREEWRKETDGNPLSPSVPDMTDEQRMRMIELLMSEMGGRPEQSWLPREADEAGAPDIPDASRP
jgi:hypothetical protein